MQAFTLDSVSPAAVEKPTAPSAQTVRSEVWIVAAALVALVLKLVIAWNTFGTNDVISFYQFAKSMSQHGLEQTYTSSIAFNHPPLTAYYLRAIYHLDHEPLFREYGVLFPFLLRLPGILADFLVVVALLWLTKADARVRIPAWALMLFALSPVSLMVTGFHGNTDPVMVMFFIIAVVAVARDKPLLAGLFLALSCQIKIIPLLFFPIFFLFWRARRATFRFTWPFVITSALLWLEPMTKFPVLFLRNVLSYGSYWGIWGITYWLRLTNIPQFDVVTFHDLPFWEGLIVGILKIIVIVMVVTVAWRRRELNERAVLDSIAFGWIVFFVFSPGVCVQYMIWPAPFILMLSPTFYAGLLATSTLFVFFFYNVTAGGLPWYVAISTNQLNRVWTPWSVWPWIVLILGMAFWWSDLIVKRTRLRAPRFHEAE